MRAWLRTHLSLIWVAVGVAIGAVGFGVVMPAVVASLNAQPIAVIEGREATGAELYQTLVAMGEAPESADLSGRLFEGPDGIFLSAEYSDSGFDCLYRVAGDRIDFAACVPRGWSHLATVPLTEFTLDDDLVARAERMGATGILLVVHDARMEVWPVGPNLPAP